MEKKNAENKITEVVFILDASGSMYELTDDTIGGFNSMLREQKDLEGEVFVSTVTFNTQSKVIHDRLPIREVPDMTGHDYCAGGGTALIDALGDAIRHISNVHKYIRKEDVPVHTLFVITTDGQENSSHKYSSKEVKEMVIEQQEKGWEFVYLAANIDAVETSKEYGFKTSRAHNFIADEKGNEKVFETVCSFMSVLRKSKASDDIDLCVEEAKVFASLDEDYKIRNK